MAQRVGPILAWTSLAAIGVVMLVLFAGTVEAQGRRGAGAHQKGDHVRTDVSARRHEKRRDGLRRMLRSGATARDVGVAAAALVDARKDLGTARREARREEKQWIAARLKGFQTKLDRPALRAEMHKNGRRMAYLARLREVAKDAGDTEAVKRIDSLLMKENERHQQWMKQHVGPEPGALQ